MPRKVSIKSDLKDSTASFYGRGGRRDPSSSIAGLKNAHANKAKPAQQSTLVPIEEDLLVGDMFDYSHNRIFARCSFTTVTRYFNGFIDQFKKKMNAIASRPTIQHHDADYKDTV